MGNKICEICGKPTASYSKKFNKTLCPKHYYQLKTFGEVRNTKYDKNPINIYETTIGILLYDSAYNLTGECIIDKEDYDKLKNIRWRLDGGGYAINNSNKKETLYIHRIINNTPSNMFCDHIDKNKLNCKKENLRTVTHQLNCINVGKKSNNTSGVKGINWNKRNQKWRSRITLNNTEINLGEYTNYLDAVKSRANAELIYFGEYSSNYNFNTNCVEIIATDPVTLITYKIKTQPFTIVETVIIKECSLKEIQNL